MTASADKTARVWNSETGDPLTPPLRHLAELTNAAFLADGRRIITRDGNEESRIWPLALDDRPVDDLVTLSRLLSGRTETRFGDLTPQNSEPLEMLWGRLRSKYPKTFETSTEEIEQWHEYQAEECDLQQKWFAEAFHLRCLLMLRPGDLSISNKLVAANSHLIRGN